MQASAPLASSPCVSARLKAATESLHRLAESRPLQHRLVKGEVDLDLYQSYLGQLLLIHEALEARLAAASHEHPEVVAVLRDHHRRADLARADLASLGACGSPAPVPATARVLGEIDRAFAEEPLALLGMLYVLEGSTNGSRFIAEALRRTLKLAGSGLRCMDPHGELQKVRWLAFKSDMDAVPFTEPQVQALIEAACAMFRAVARMSDELLEPLAV